MMTYEEATKKLEEMGLILSSVDRHFEFNHPYDRFLVNLRDWSEEYYQDIIHKAQERIRNSIDR